MSKSPPGHNPYQFPVFHPTKKGGALSKSANKVVNKSVSTLPKLPPGANPNIIPKPKPVEPICHVNQAAQGLQGLHIGRVFERSKEQVDPNTNFYVVQSSRSGRKISLSNSPSNSPSNSLSNSLSNSPPDFLRSSSESRAIARESNHYSEPIIPIHYSVRLHDSSCKCQRVKDDKRGVVQRLENGEKVKYTVEKLWNDAELKSFHNYIHITDSPGFHRKKKGSDADPFDCDLTSSAEDILHRLLDYNSEKRAMVEAYFKEYTWSAEKAAIIRDIVTKMNTICFCASHLMKDHTTCNAGVMFVCSFDIAFFVANCYNKYAIKEEYVELMSAKISELHHTNPDRIGYNLKVVIESEELKDLRNPELNLYTIIGKESNFDYSSQLKNPTVKTNAPPKKKQLLSLSFGKAEFYSKGKKGGLDVGSEESAESCARRELFEEFSIQYSPRIEAYSRSQPGVKQLNKKGLKIFIIRLPEECNIHMHMESRTIYIDVK